MVKFRWYYDKDKEEIWLNEMVAEGFAVTRFLLGFYWFEDCEPGEYIYQIDLFTENKGSMTHREYVSLIQETGAEFVCSWGWWRFFRRKAKLGPFRLYTDVNSRLEQYRRIFRLFRNIGILELAALCYEVILTVASWNRSAGLEALCLAAVGIIFAMGIVIWENAYHIWQKIKRLERELL